MTFVSVEGRTGVVTCDVSEAATLPLGFRFQDRVQTPKGPAFVMGVEKVTGLLYFRLEKEDKASFWSSCKTKADFEKRGFAIIYDVPETVDPKGSHRLKRITFAGRDVVIVMQSVNGPCPIIALANCLSLQGLMDPGRNAKGSTINSKTLRHEVIAYIQSCPPRPKFLSPTEINDAKTVRLSVEGASAQDLELFTEERLKDMYEGLNVSPFFNCVDAFEADADLALFGVAGVRLLHSWIVDPEDPTLTCIRDRSYMEAVAAGTEEDGEGPIMKFLGATAVQSTDIGIQMVVDALEEKQVAVLFMNNHFSTIVRINSSILQLVTDEGYADKRSVVFQRFTRDGGSTMLGAEGTPINPLLLGAMQLYGDKYTDDALLGMYDELQALAASEGKDVQPSLEEVVKAIETEANNGRKRNNSSSRSEAPDATLSPSTAPTTTQAAEMSPADAMIEQLLGMGFALEDCQRVVATNPVTIVRAIERLLA